jgi:TRAP-type uncharacterized transport system substrate-binding protein
MRGWRSWAVGGATLAATLVVLAGLLRFLAPDVSYQIQDRISETVSGRRDRTFRIALGARTGSNYRVGQVLNRHLQTQSGYQLELLETVSRGNVDALTGAADGADLATINSADDEAVRGEGLYGLAALELQHFLIVVAKDNPVRDFRDLTGPVNPGVRGDGDPPTLGARVLEYYGMLSPGPKGAPPRERRDHVGSARQTVVRGFGDCRTVRRESVRVSLSP